jgi:LuxR family maltose regulon positive regulatory protein
VQRSLIRDRAAEDRLDRLDLGVETLEARQQSFAQPTSNAELVPARLHCLSVGRTRVTQPHPDRVGDSSHAPSQSRFESRRFLAPLALGSPDKEEALTSQTPSRQGSRSVVAADLVIPSAPQPLVLRQRLFDVLDEGTAGPLTLVSAPAGSGKTTLLTSWLSAQPREVAWLTPRRQLGEASFWAELLAAVRGVVPARSTLGRLSAPRAGTPPGFVLQLLNGFAELEEPVVVVVDDFHVVRSVEISGTIEQLLRAAPDSLRLILSTRHDPMLPLHLLRASGELTEIRARDLALTADEAHEFLDGLGVELDASAFTVLFEQTEGWAAGIRLFTLSHRARRSPSASLEGFELDGRPASEYLLAEVLSEQPDGVRDFLLATSITERFTPDLADAMTDRTDSAHVAERLVAENLFVDRLDTRPTSYRYHTLFAELLRAELRHTRREGIPELHRRAARWHFENRAPMEAVQHALAAGDLELLTECIVDGWFELIGRTDTVFRGELLARISEADIEASAALSAVLASVDFMTGQSRSGIRRLARAVKLSPKAATPSVRAVLTFAQLLRHAHAGSFKESARLALELLDLGEAGPFTSQAAETIRAIALGHLGLAEVALEHLDDAETHLTEALEASRIADVPYAELASMGGLAWLELIRGRLRRSARIARSAVELAQTRGWERSSQAALSLSALALVEQEWDDLDAADGHARELGETARRADDVAGRAWSAAIQASLSLAGHDADVEHGLERLRGAKSDLRVLDSPRLERCFSGLEARLLAAAADYDGAAAIVEQAVDAHPASPGLRAVSARVALQAGDPEAALAALAVPTDAAYPVVEVEREVLRAVALRATGNEELALAQIDAALSRAEPEGIRRPFLSAGPGVRELLAQHLRKTVSHRWFATELLRRLDGGNGARVLPAELLEPLSAREGEVLRFLPTMMSNADIAHELFVSVNTVKTHVKSIYRKLDVTRRQDAVHRARQLHLL